MYTSSFHALLSGAKWNGQAITYSFMTKTPDYYTLNAEERNNFISFNNTQKAAARRALQLYSEVTGLTFVEVSDTGIGGTIRFGTARSDTKSAHAYYPSDAPIGGDVWLNNSDSTNNTQTNSSEGFLILIHEIGHALGLEHPGNYNAGGGGTNSPYLYSNLDNHQHTVMSYTSHPGSGVFPQTPMLLDIAALQYLYGANYNTRAGNTTYSWNSTQAFVQTIWDGGGIDTISAATQSLAAIINLNSGTFSSIGRSANNTNLRATNNLAIANGVTIENAIGGTGNDLLIGNTANNNLKGGNGNDTLDGGSGNDFLNGENGSDFLLGGVGNDTLVGFSSTSGTEYDVLTGGVGNDTFVLVESFGTAYLGNDYAIITDFNWKNDWIQVKGSASQYSLQFGYWLGGSALDTGIFYGNDFIGYLQDASNVNFSRDFVFV